jgi:hypothetical protein
MKPRPAALISQTPHLSVAGSGRLRVEAVGEAVAISSSFVSLPM